MGWKRSAYKILVLKAEGKRKSGRRNWENNTEMDLREIGWGDMD
jgi:hypothetical protein